MGRFLVVVFCSVMRGTGFGLGRWFFWVFVSFRFYLVRSECFVIRSNCRGYYFCSRFCCGRVFFFGVSLAFVGFWGFECFVIMIGGVYVCFRFGVFF